MEKAEASCGLVKRGPRTGAAATDTVREALKPRGPAIPLLGIHPPS